MEPDTLNDLASNAKKTDGSRCQMSSLVQVSGVWSLTISHSRW